MLLYLWFRLYQIKIKKKLYLLLYCGKFIMYLGHSQKGNLFISLQSNLYTYKMENIQSCLFIYVDGFLFINLLIY